MTRHCEGCRVLVDIPALCPGIPDDEALRAERDALRSQVEQADRALTKVQDTLNVAVALVNQVMRLTTKDFDLKNGPCWCAIIVPGGHTTDCALLRGLCSQFIGRVRQLTSGA